MICNKCNQDFGICTVDDNYKPICLDCSELKTSNAPYEDPPLGWVSPQEKTLTILEYSIFPLQETLEN